MVLVNGEAAYDSSFSSKRVRRRRRSMALCRAVWMIQARGNSGTPESRHWSTAAANASCAASSAISKSPKFRIRVATIRPQSEWYTESTAAFGFESTFDDRNFRRRCRSGHAPFDLLMEAHNMKYMLLVYMSEQAMTDEEREHCY